MVVGSGKPATKAQIVSVVSQTPIDDSGSTTSEEWLGNSLRQLAQEGYIEQEEYIRSVDEVIHVTRGALDAPSSSTLVVNERVGVETASAMMPNVPY